MNNEFIIVSCYFIVLDYICVDTNANVNHNFKCHEGEVLMASRDHRCNTAGVQRSSQWGVATVGTEGKLGLWDRVAGGRGGGQLSRCSGGPCVLGLSCFCQHPESVKEEPGGVTCSQCMTRGGPEPSGSWEHNGMTLSTAEQRRAPGRSVAG